MASTKKRRKPTRLGAEAAVKRLDAMLPLIERNVRSATRTYAMWSTGNSIVGEANLEGRQGAGAYETVQISLVLSLSLTLAKLYEVPKPWPNQAPSKKHNNSDVASIPLMLRLLKQKQCRKVLLARARQWNPDMPDLALSNVARCEEQIDTALATYAILRKRKRDQMLFVHLKNTRDRVIAHTLMPNGRKSKPPTFRAALLLLVFAKSIFESANFAIDGTEKKLGANYGQMSERFQEFWRAALKVPTPAVETVSGYLEKVTGAGFRR